MFLLTYILQYIFSLSKNTHTCPIFVFVCGFLLAANWQRSNRMWQLKKHHIMLVLIDVKKPRSDNLVDV